MKVIGHITFPDITGKDIVYTIIEMQETNLISTEPIENIHRYWIPENEDIHDANNYLEPLDHINYNFDADYKLYRQKFGFLFPTTIKSAREKLGLTLRETALILAMSFSTLSNIENNVQVQSFDQEIKLRLLTQPQNLKTLVREHQALIMVRASRHHIDADRLFNKLGIVN